MSYMSRLQARREELAEAWCDAIFQTYPLDTVGFLRKKADSFQNPISERTRRATRVLVDLLLGEGLDSDKVQEPLDQLVRVRAVQEFTATQAAGIIFLLKPLARRYAKEFGGGESTLWDLLQFESKIDSLALLAFETYCACKEQVTKLQVDEVKRRHGYLLKRVQELYDQAEDPDAPKH